MSAIKLKYNLFRAASCLVHGHKRYSHIIHLGWCDTADQVDECQHCGSSRILYGYGNVPVIVRQAAWRRYWQGTFDYKP